MGSTIVPGHIIGCLRHVRLQAGIHLGPYEILSLVGAGGMGEVYRARDPRLNRVIAIKVLPETTAADPERRARFEREAQSIAALSHPHIVTIHSVEEADGVLFLAMEYVEGKPLSDLIVKGGLPLPQILNLAIPLADAISAAHQKGITHRDLKPSNVMVSADGRVKVLDFGLAKLMEASPVELGVTGLPTGVLTGEGRIVGTVAYMSPEQAEGKAIDHRSDIFSLGVMLYEMATGERPFTGDTGVSMLSSIIKDTPRAVTDLKPTHPRELSLIVKRCLVKDPEYRYQSTKDLRNELRELQHDSESGELHASRDSRAAGMPSRVATRRRTLFLVAIGALVLMAIGVAVGQLWTTRAATASPIDSLAVLPFVNVGADPNTESLSEGITENLINSFSQLPRLRVVPRSTVFRYKDREPDFQKIGRELSVRAVLTGRVVQRGDTLNIQTDLIDVTGDAQLWGRQYTRTFADLVTVQEEIATAVTDKLRLRPTSEEQKRLTKRYTENPEAQQLYLKGQYYWNRRTRQTLQRAAEAFQQAIDRDPGYALAWAGLADCYALYGFYGAGSPREFGPRAKEAALAALRIDDTLGEAHAALGWDRIEDWDWPGARSEFQRAIELNPHNGTAHQRYAAYFLVEGRVDDALAETKRGQEIEPLSLIMNTLVAREFYHARQYDRAIEQSRKSLELDPNFAQAHLYLGWTYEQQARYEDAIAELRKAFALSDGESEIGGALGHAYAVAGKRIEAEKALAALKEQSAHQYVAPFDIAVVYSGLGATTPTFEWLEKAYEDHSHWLVWIKVDPRLDRVRDDPRYHDRLRRMKIPE
jgi:serine/threonine protein kinase/tetratricopeptide (TPR) repeat protein